MSDVSGIPYMGPMGVGNLFAPLYPALSGGGNMSAGQISAPYAPAVNYNQSVLSPYNLYGAGGFGAATDYYSALGASYGRATGGFNADPTQGISPAGGYGDLGLGGGGGGFSPLPDNSFGGGPSAYDYGSLFGGGGAATPPSAYGYGSLGGGGGIGGLGGGGQADPFPGMAMPGGLNRPMTLPYGDQTDPFPGMAMPGGLGQPMTSPYGGGGGSITDRLIQTMGGGGGWGNAPGAMPDMQRLLGYNPPSQYDFPAPPVQPQPMGYDYGSLYGGGGAATSPSSYGYGSLGGGGGGIYDPFNVGGRLDPALYGPGGLGGGGGIGQAPAAMPDLQRLLGYNPRQLSALPDRSGIDFGAPSTLDFNDRFPSGMPPAFDVQAGLQPGIDSLQRTLGDIDRATGGGSTLSPQDRQISFSDGGGFREPSFFGPGGIGGDSGSPYADSGLPLEITQGGSTPGGAMFSDFNRSLFGNAPAYPSGVVTGPYQLPDIGGGGPASEPSAARGGALPIFPDFGGSPGGLGQPMAPRFPQPYFDEPAAGYGGASMPQQQQYFDEPAAGYGGAFRPSQQRYDSPDVFGGYEGGYGSNRQGLDVNPELLKYYQQPPMVGPKTQDVFNTFPGAFSIYDQQRQLQAARSPLMAELENDPAKMLRLAAIANAEMIQGGGQIGDKERMKLVETALNRFGARGWDEFSSGRMSSPLQPPGTAEAYYAPARPLTARGGTATLGPMEVTLRNDPALLAQLTDLIRQVGYGGTDLSNLGMENASGALAGRSALTQSLTDYAPYTGESFFRKDVRTPEAMGIHGAPATQLYGDWAYQNSPWQNFSPWYQSTKEPWAGYFK